MTASDVAAFEVVQPRALATLAVQSLKIVAHELKRSPQWLF
jgi:hypothetical protein